MDKDTKARLGEIRAAMKKYGFDKILGQTAKNKIRGKDDEGAHELLLDDEIPVKLRLMLQELGTTFIKLGQLLSTRPDVVGERIANELANLQDDNPAITYEQVKKIVERELNGKIDDLFKDFSHEHLATASIGQVHEAHLITGERVAVKIQKEGITDKIDLDLRILKYIANRAAWAIYNAKVEELATWNDAEKEQEYQAALTAYQNSVAAHDTWVENAKSYQVLIPTGAYFLGRQGTAYPKYYREIADDTRSGATGGFWTQFTAVIIPNAAAKTGIEAELGEGTSAAANRSVEMVFDEGFLGEEKTSTEIEQIITEAEAEGQKVEYMQVVYNINGQIVREGTELTGLPKGIYIVNGKKYFVR